MGLKRRNFPMITLASWEHLPGCDAQQIEARAQNVAPFEWHGRELQLAARVAQDGDGARHVFLREVTSTEQGNWILGHGWHDDMPQSPYEGERLRLPGRLADVSQSHFFPFGRLFHFRGEELECAKPWRAFVAANGSGCWLALREEDLWDETDPFRLAMGQNASLLDWSAREVRTLLLQDLARPQSDARFALDWAHLTQTEQEDRSLCVRQGSVWQLRDLLSCALLIEREVQKRDALWSWEVEPEEREWSGLNWSHPDSMAEWVPVPLRLRAWKQEILAHFGPDINADLRRRHVCVAKSTGNYSFLMRIEVQTPTHHERLEAALRLRDWARGKIAPRKLQLLLGS